MILDAAQVSHLYRRLGFGITVDEREELAGHSLDALLDRAFDFDADSFPIHPMETLWNQNGQFQNQPQRIGAWWTLRMCFGNRPFRDKLMLFLHDHFAVSGEKVNSSILMWGYLQTLEKSTNEPFADVLKDITLDPAMMTWLDLSVNVRMRPNENYSRELLELFTFGVDNGYTEQDVKEVARVLTGWSIRSGVIGSTTEAREGSLIESVRKGWPVVSPAFSEGMHDPGPYQILGDERSLDLEGLCGLLSKDPKTAEYLARKLIAFYVYPDPKSSFVEQVAGMFQKHQGQLDLVLRDLVATDEFWSDKARMAIVKSPADFLVPIVRQLVPVESVMSLLDEDADIDKMLNAQVLQVGVSVLTLMSRTGMTLLFPPDVNGWAWGTGWVSSSTMNDRIQLADVFTNQGRGRSAAVTLTRVAEEKGLTSNLELTQAIMDIFDIDADEALYGVIGEAVQRVRLSEALEDVDQVSARLRPVLKILFASPRFHLM